MSDSGAPVRLACLGGGPCPDDLVRDLARAEALPARALERVWEILGPSLAEPVPASVEALVAAFVARHGVARDELARVVRAARFLVRGAVANAVPAEGIAQDLRALSIPQGVVAVLLAGYDAARDVLQREQLRATLAEHGRVLVGVDWRLDTISASKHGRSMRAPVVFLTLRVQDGERTERITVQALPETLAELRKLCDELLG